MSTSPLRGWMSRFVTQRGAADAVLSALKARPDSWIQVDAILDRSTNVKSKFFALSVLEDLIRFRWKLLPADQREAVRGFIVGKVIAMCGDEARMAAERMFVAKLNMILVQVLKQEWPQNWPSFVTDIVGSSKTSEILCENNLEILKLLSEEVFDFSKNEITSLRVKTLKESLHADFDQIYQLCDFVLNHATRPTLLRGALQTLSRFVSWIPIQYVFETTLLEILCLKFLPNPTYRLHATECLAEISSLVLDARYHGRVVSMYVAAMTQLVSMIPVSVPIPKLYQAGSPEDKMFFQRLALFLTSFFTQSLPLLEAAVMSGTMPAEVLLTGMLYLIGITDNDESEIFKLCLDFWLHFSNTLYDAEKAFVSANPVLLAVPSAQIRSPRKELYLSVLPRLREVLIRHTPKPEEVLIEKDDSGDIVRSTTKDTDAIATYKTMKDTLVFLTHLDYNDTESIMVDKLSKQVDGSEFGWDPLNSLCWAVGAISGTMNEEDEKRFLVMVIKDLLGLCEMKRGKNNKAVIASNIMYVVGQYPRFLRAHWKFLKTVVNKLFEFMHEKHPGVQDMACDTFLKICQRCKPKFVVVQTGETKMFIEELCEHVHEVISELEPHQVQTFYEAAGQMVSAHPDPNAREHLTEMLMTLPNITWANIVKAASENLETLKNPTVIKELTRVLKINDRVCKSVGPSFSKQMGRIFLEMMNLYKAFSQFVSTSIQLSGEAITRTTVVKLMRKAKRDVLNVIDTFVSKSNAPKFIAEAFLPHLLDPLLSDYAANIPAARNPEVLSVMTSCVLKLKEDMSMHVPKVMAGVFRSTLEMLRVTYVDFPEHRLNFFKLLEGIVNNCFAALFSMDGDTVKMFVDSLMWGFKHPQRDIAETALGILMVVMDQIASKDATAQPFFKAYFVSLLKDVFEVLTDRMHKSAFKCHCQIVGAMFQMLHSGRVTVPLFEPSAFGPDMTNVRFVCEILASALLAAFPHLSPPRVQAFIIGIYPASREEPTLKCHMRDFLIEMKEFAEDNAELFHEEAIAAAAAAASEDLERRRAVPGLLAATAADLDEL